MAIAVSQDIDQGLVHINLSVNKHVKYMYTCMYIWVNELMYKFNQFQGTLAFHQEKNLEMCISEGKCD